MLIAFKEHINNSFPFLKTEQFIVACSGGLDSIVLVSLAHKLKLNFALAHCNFQLRDQESDGDELFVRDFAKKLGIPLFVKQFNTKEELKKRKGSLQMVARDLRYEWFNELLKDTDYNYLLTGHHGDDSLETFLINLSRGTGIDGLTGILERNNQVLRPLLPFTRNAIKDYAVTEKIAWREDSSNKENKYLRNKTRNTVVPLLKELNPNFITNFLTTQSRLLESAIINENTKKQLQQSLFKKQNGIISISIKELEKLKPISSYLYLLFNEFGFTAWDDIQKLLKADTGKEVSSTTYRLVKNRGFLLLGSIKNNINSEYLITEDAIIIDSPIKLKIERVTSITEKSKNILYADMEKLNFPLVLRNWIEGDYFYPIGMSGKKKMSKYLKDEKLSKIAKENQWLLCSYDTIVWVIGRRADDRFKVQQDTKDIIKITWHI